MACHSCACSYTSDKFQIYEKYVQKYLQLEREPAAMKPIPKTVKLPRYDPRLSRNQRTVMTFVVNVQNMHSAFCLLVRKGSEYMVAIHQLKESAIIKAGGYPYSDKDYIASDYFQDRLILRPPGIRFFNRKLRKILMQTCKLAYTLKAMWLKLDSLDYTNRDAIAFKHWTWDAIVFAFRIFYETFFQETGILDILAATIAHTPNFTKQQRCLQTWSERGLKNENLNLLKSLLQEVGVNEL